MELSASAVMLVTGTALPLLVAAVTKSDGSKRLKQVLTAGLSAVGAAIATKVTNGGTFPLNGETLGYTGMAFLTAALSYSNLYKPRELNDKVLPGFGIGSGSSTSTTAAPTSEAPVATDSAPAPFVSPYDLLPPVNPFA